jgi:TPR repeat protein
MAVYRIEPRALLARSEVEAARGWYERAADAGHADAILPRLSC